MQQYTQQKNKKQTKYLQSRVTAQLAEEPSKSVDPAWKGFPNFLHFAALFPFMPITIKNKNLQFKRFRLD